VLGVLLLVWREAPLSGHQALAMAAWAVLQAAGMLAPLRC
jgi:hypothetical protein